MGGEGPGVRYNYQGDYAEEDTETGYNEFDLRNFDPQTGRWIQTDPYNEFASGYTGMGNDPVNSVDPDGGSIGVRGVDWRRIDHSLGSNLLDNAIVNVIVNVVNRIMSDPYEQANRYLSSATISTNAQLEITGPGPKTLTFPSQQRLRYGTLR